MDGGIMTSRLLVDKIEGKTTSGTIQMPAGHLIQTVRMATSTTASTTGSSYVDSNLTLAITPLFSNSVILINVSASWLISGGSFFYTELYRNGSSISASDQIHGDYGSSGIGHTSSYMYTDAPNSTSTQTYLIKFKTTGGTAYVYKDQHMILQEIAQ